MSPVRLRLIFVALVALLAAACQFDATVDVVVEDDGSGTVTFAVEVDEAVLSAAPELLNELRTEDLVASGWVLDGPAPTESGGATVSATKPFVSPDHLAGVLDEISGSPNLFEDFTVVRERSFARTTYVVNGTIDPDVAIESLGDEAITGLLGTPLGRPIEELEALAGRPLDETLSLVFTVTLPDTIAANAASIDGRTAVWNVTPLDPLSTDVRATANVEDQEPRIWAALALVALALLATLVAFRLLARLSSRTPDSDEDDELKLRRPERATSKPDARAVPVERPPRLELVVLDARSVLYDEANDIGARLVPFIRERGSAASLQEVNDVFREASLGRLSTGEVWGRLGVEGDPAELDAAYSQNFRLRDGVLDFIAQLHERELRVAVITNNVLGWSKANRRTFDLDAHVDTWVVSGEIGTRKPDVAFFEALKRMTGVAFTDSLLIDDQLEDLDMARSLGMSTAMFIAPDAQLPAQSPHPIVHGFDSFFGTRTP